MITQYIDQSVAIRQSATGQVELTGVATSQALQVPTVPRVLFPAPSAASGSQILIITTEVPTNLLHYSLTDQGNVSLNLSVDAPTLSVTPTALPEGNQLSISLGVFSHLVIKRTLWFMGASLEL